MIWNARSQSIDFCDSRGKTFCARDRVWSRDDEAHETREVAVPLACLGWFSLYSPSTLSGVIDGTILTLRIDWPRFSGYG